MLDVYKDELVLRLKVYEVSSCYDPYETENIYKLTNGSFIIMYQFVCMWACYSVCVSDRSMRMRKKCLMVTMSKYISVLYVDINNFPWWLSTMVQLKNKSVMYIIHVIAWA